MKTTLQPLFFVVLLLTLAAGCTANGTAPANTPDGSLDQGAPPAAHAAFQRDALDRYSAAFEMQFSGDTSWSYRLISRKSPELLEINLHMDGLPPAQNPGDIRLVTDGVQSWMTGPATDGECVQFPNGQGMDPTFIYPEALVSFQQISGELELLLEEPAERISGEGFLSGSAVTLQYFHAEDLQAGPWKNAAVDVTQEKDSRMLRQFSMQADGEDPFFGAGTGQLTAHYQADALGEAPIQPVAGCEISVRLPESAAMFVRLPGMASFESPDPVEAVQQFYQSVMSQDNWSETEPAALVDGATVLSYIRADEAVKIAIQARSDGGSHVELMFMPVE